MLLGWCLWLRCCVILMRMQNMCVTAEFINKLNVKYVQLIVQNTNDLFNSQCALSPLL